MFSFPNVFVQGYLVFFEVAVSLRSAMKGYLSPAFLVWPTSPDLAISYLDGRLVTRHELVGYFCISRSC